MRLAFVGLAMPGAAVFPSIGMACGCSGNEHGHAASRNHSTAGVVAPDAQSLARHGGYVIASADLQYELAVDQRELQIYAYDENGEAIDLRGVTGVLHSADGPDSVDDAVALTYKSNGLGRSGWLSATLPAREAPPTPGEYRIVLRDLPSSLVRELSVAWPPEAPAAAPAVIHSGRDH